MFNIYENSKALKSKGLLPEQIVLVNQIYYDKKDQTWWIGKIVQYVTSGYPLDVLVKNQAEIRKLGRDSSSLRSYIIRFGIDLGGRLFNEKLRSTTVSANKMALKLGDEAATEFYRARGSSLANFIARYGDVNGAKKWGEYLAKRAASYRKKKEDGHKYPQYNLEYFVGLYGKEKGAKIYSAKINSQRYKVSKAYYVEQFGVVQGPIKCRQNKDHSSLDYFVNKYGQSDGEQRYTTQCIKTATASTRSNKYSAISKECFDEIKNIVTDLYYYGEHEMVWATSGELALTQRAVSPDLFYRGKIIEFNGDLFHANPRRFTESETPHPFNKQLTATEIWAHDKRRIEYFESKGYKVLEVWESDYKANPLGVIEQCIQHLTK